jgi:hypothetical protein
MRSNEMAKVEIIRGDVELTSGTTVTRADFERMADDAETMDIDVEAVAARAVRRGGRPSLGDGPSRVLQVRLDRETHAALGQRASSEHRTPSALAREAIKRYLDAS